MQKTANDTEQAPVEVYSFMKDPNSTDLAVALEDLRLDFHFTSNLTSTPEIA